MDDMKGCKCFHVHQKQTGKTRRWDVLVIYAAFSLLLLFIGSAPEVSAATIYGTIYDIGFEEFKNVIVEINTTPKQYFVSKTGNYSFNVPEGSYTLEGSYILGNETLASHEESIVVEGDGEYVLDMILFIDIDVGKDIEQDNETIDFTLDPNDNTKPQPFVSRSFLLGIMIFIVVGGLGYGLFRFLKKPLHETEGTEKETDVELQQKNARTDISKVIETVELPDDAKEVLKIIKEKEGRVTQKEIRKEIPLSEAKISLILTELEQRGFVRKIKKGRGNIVILNA
ncbi:hypothetical protein HYW21_09145 [Candidatus Woesearchaeota archaeon]|nr:hypothetical protein [Candidatus Woesearchaeota archaeon]